jgi:hypothetical protein
LSFFGVNGAYGDLIGACGAGLLHFVRNDEEMAGLLILAACGSLDCFALMDMDRRATTSLAMTCFVVSTSSRSAEGAAATHYRRQPMI